MESDSIASDGATPHPHERHLLVRLGIACLLLGAAAMKAWSPSEAAVLATVYEIPPWVSLLVIQLEILLAVVLLFGFSLRRSLQVTAWIFGMFACFALYRALASYESCGCFGSLKVHPWITFCMDLAVVYLAARSAKQITPGVKPGTEGRQLGLACVLYLLSAFPLTALAIKQLPVSGAVGSTEQVGSLVILEPEAWVGKKTPISDELGSSIELSRGEWVVVLYHHDCPDCQAALPKYEKLAAIESQIPDGKQVLLIEVPPYGDVPHRPSKAKHARLPDDREWFVQAPVEIQIEDGSVTGSSLDLPSISYDNTHGAASQ